ncbi:hypothetical protein IAU59_007569 [Kwoniella sp. CBS 9459]
MTSGHDAPQDGSPCQGSKVLSRAQMLEEMTAEQKEAVIRTMNAAIQRGSDKHLREVDEPTTLCHKRTKADSMPTQVESPSQRSQDVTSPATHGHDMCEPEISSAVSILMKYNETYKGLRRELQRTVQEAALTQSTLASYERQIRQARQTSSAIQAKCDEKDDKIQQLEEETKMWRKKNDQAAALKQNQDDCELLWKNSIALRKKAWRRSSDLGATRVYNGAT